MRLRQFNKSGIEAFRRFLAACRENPKEQVPTDLLESEKHTLSVPVKIHVEYREFSTRRDAAEYFTDVLSPLSPDAVRKNEGMWTWLSLFYFRQICPSGPGIRKVRNDYTYIYMPGESRYFYRHLLFVAWYIKQLAPKHNRLFLETPVSRLDRFTEEVTKRLYLTRIPSLFELLDRLYWDAATRSPVKGMVSPRTVRAGDLIHRLPIRIRQLEKTYDLQSLDADHLLEILGDEFQQRASDSQSQKELSLK